VRGEGRGTRGMMKRKLEDGCGCDKRTLGVSQEVAVRTGTPWSD